MVPTTIRNWGRVWNYMGTAGTLAFIAIWAITRLPGNTITGRAGRIVDTAIIIEIFQIAFVVLMVILISKRKPPKSEKIGAK